MPVQAYFMDQTKPNDNYVLLSESFLTHFVATAKHNLTLSLERDPTRPDVVFVHGIDQRGKHLVGCWCPRGSVENFNIIVFRDVAEDQNRKRLS